MTLPQSKWLMDTQNYVSVHSSFFLSFSLYLCVCAARLHGKMHTLYTYMMYAFEPLNDGGASHVTAHVCSSNYWDVLSSLLQEVSLQLKTKLKMTPACAAPLQPIVRVTVPFSVSLAMAQWKM